MNPFRWSLFTRVSESNDRLLSAMKSMDPGAHASSIASIRLSNRTPKFGSCHPTTGRRNFVSRNRRSSLIPSTERLWYGIVESMQKLHV